jgi:hypothetical protein
MEAKLNLTKKESPRGGGGTSKSQDPELKNHKLYVSHGVSFMYGQYGNLRVVNQFFGMGFGEQVSKEIVPVRHGDDQVGFFGFCEIGNAYDIIM